MPYVGIQRLKQVIDENEKLQSQNKALYEALKEIEKMEGAFSLDPLKHAENCLLNMRGIAREALALVDSSRTELREKE